MNIKKDLIILLLLILPSFSILLQKGYFPMHDDLQSLRQLELAKCFNDGQIPCRWVPDMGYGYGYPLFNFYPPLPYLIGHPFRIIGLAYIDIVKIVGVLGFITTAVSMYLLGKEIWGRSAGIVAAVMYTYAPYHSVDFYVRGAMNEFWAMAMYPAVFLSIYQILNSKRKWIPIFSLSLAGLLLSHNPMTMIFAPVAVLWAGYWWLRNKNTKNTISLILGGFLGIGLASFFTLPVLVEQKYAHVETLVIGYFNYLAHFLELGQMFIRPNWGYGESVYGSGDTMSFFVGYLHWILPIIVGITALVNKKLRSQKGLLLLLFIFLAYSLFMAHRRSGPIWGLFKPLEFLQFPWRYLSLGAFTTSLFSSAIVKVINRRLVIVLLLLILILNANYFQPRTWYPNVTDEVKFSGDNWRLLTTSGIFDYLPIWAPMPPADKAGDDLNLIKGAGVYTQHVRKSHQQEYTITMASPGIGELQQYYFPGWKLWINGKEQVIDPTRDKLLGRIQFDLPVGTSQVKVMFTNTPIRNVGNAFSLLSILCIGVITLMLRNPKNYFNRP